MNNTDVRLLQQQLSLLHCDPGPVDGVPGRRTQAATRLFQRDHGLLSDGIAGPITRHALALAIREMEEAGQDRGVIKGHALSPARRDRRLTGALLKEFVTRCSYPWDETGHVNLVGLRGWVNGLPVPNEPDAYNDTILLVSQTASGLRAVRFRASVDPGRLREPNPRGTAHLLPGSYLYRLGLHRGRETALVQAGEVRVRRYIDDDPEGLAPFEESGWFGINIHRGGLSPRVGSWSAGCQIVHGTQWPSFIAALQRAADEGQQLFHYHLIEGRDVQAYLQT